MTAGSKAEYLWADGKTVRQPTSISAPKYIFHVLEWCDYELVESGSFPLRDFADYPDHFISHYVKKMIRRLFRVYAHFRYSHYRERESDDDLGKLFDAYIRHLLLLVQEFKLMESKEISVLLKTANHRNHMRKLKHKKLEKE